MLFCLKRSPADGVGDQRCGWRMLFCYLQSTRQHRNSAGRFGSKTRRATTGQHACQARRCQQMVTGGADSRRGPGAVQEPGSELRRVSHRGTVSFCHLLSPLCRPGGSWVTGRAISCAFTAQRKADVSPLASAVTF